MAESSRSNRVTEASPLEPLKFILSNDHNGSRNRVASTCLMRILSECNVEENDYQSCAYYLSAIVAVFPGLEEAATSVISGLGYHTQKIDPASFDAVCFSLQPAVDAMRILTMIGQSIFILYKYFPDEVSYVRFMQKRTTALKACIGVSGPLMRGSSSEVIFTFAKAKALRQMLQNFKAILLRAMIGLRSDPSPFGPMCSYICNILCWEDMSTYLFIKQTLLDRRSPVLEDAMIKEEVENLNAACTAVTSSEYPEYFRLLYPYQVTKVIDISRYPTIVAVAQILRAERYSLAVPTTRNSALVDRLVAMHKAYMETYNDPKMEETLAFLYGVELKEVYPNNAG